MSHKISGKSARRQRVRANHERLHLKYLDFIVRHGKKLSYAQWLHPQMWRAVEIEEERRRAGLAV